MSLVGYFSGSGYGNFKKLIFRNRIVLFRIDHAIKLYWINSGYFFCFNKGCTLLLLPGTLAAINLGLGRKAAAFFCKKSKSVTKKLLSELVM
jgi:hypothetical protein